MADPPSAPAPRAPGAEAALDAAARYAGDPWTLQNPYFAAAEPMMERIWPELILPFIKGSDFACVLDLATGHGRNAATPRCCGRAAAPSSTIPTTRKGTTGAPRRIPAPSCRGT